MLDFAADTTTNTIPPAIATAAGFVASATGRLETANAALAQAEAEDRKVRDRIAALTAERHAIVQRRAGGQHDDGDAGRLALVAADLEGLATIASEAEAAVAAERAKAEADRRLVDQARAQLARAEDEAALAGLVEHAGKLDTLLTVTLQQIATVAARIGAPGRPPFAPSPALVMAIRRHAAAHGLL
jgi:chromosome segregation ATPase